MTAQPGASLRTATPGAAPAPALGPAPAPEWLERALWFGRVPDPEEPDRDAAYLDTVELAWLRTAWAAQRRRILDVLSGHDRRNLMVVSGVPGSGVPALLAGLVVGPGAVAGAAADVDVAVDARGAGPAELVRRVVEALGPADDRPGGRDLDGTPGRHHEPGDAALRERVVAALLRAQAARGRPLRILVDGLDRARDPVRCLATVIVPLVTVCPVQGRARVVVGVEGATRTGPQGIDVRRAAVRLCGSRRTASLRLDREAAHAAVASFVRVVLRGAPGSPYAELPHQAAAVARAVAARCEGDLEHGRAVAHRLVRTRSALVAAQVAALDWVPRAQALELDDVLARGADRHLVPAVALRAALTALAVAAEDVVARPVWRLLTDALFDEVPRPVPGMDDPGGAAVTGRAADVAAARLVRIRPTGALGLATPGLAALLRRDLADPRAVHARIAAVLRDHPARPDREPGSDPVADYRERHLLRHAADGGVLDDETVPAPVLVGLRPVDPAALLPIGLRPPSRRVVSVWAELAAQPDGVHDGTDVRTVHADRTATLHFHTLPAAGSGTGDGWAAWPPGAPARVAPPGPDRPADAHPPVAVSINLPGGTVPAVAVDDTVRFLDPFLRCEAGAPVALPAPVAALAAGRTAGGLPLLVAGDVEGALVGVRLTDGARLAGFRLPAGRRALALALASGLLVCADTAGRVHRLDAARLEPVGPPLSVPGGVVALALVPGPPRPVLAVARRDGSLLHWDAVRGDALGRLEGLGEGLGEGGGRPGVTVLRYLPDPAGGGNLVAGDDAGRVRRWRIGVTPFAGGPPDWTEHGPTAVRDLAAVARHGRVDIGVLDDGGISTLLAATGETVGARRSDGRPQAPVALLVAGRVDGEQALLTVGPAGEVVRHDHRGPPDRGTVVLPRPGHRDATHYLVVATGRRGRVLAATSTPGLFDRHGGIHDPGARLHDALTGEPFLPTRDVGGGVRVVTVDRSGGGDVLVGAQYGELVTVAPWADEAPQLRRRYQSTLVVADHLATAVDRRGRRIVVSDGPSQGRHRLQGWLLDTGTPAGRPFGPCPPVTALVAATGRGGWPVVVVGDRDGGVRL